MLRVLHWVEGATFAGIETHILAIAGAFADLDVHMSVATFCEGQLSERLKQMGVETFVFPRSHKMDYRPVTRVANLLKNDYSLLHTHGYLANTYGKRAAYIAFLPRVATVHGAPEPFRGFAALKMKLYMRMDLASLKNADRVIAVSDALAKDLRAKGVEDWKLDVIENGLTAERAEIGAVHEMRKRVLSDDFAPVFGFAGRFDPVKAPLRFIETALLILRTLPDARFLIAGDGPLMDEARRQVEASGKTSSFCFLGFTKEIDAMIAACDFLVIPSDSEGVPQVLLAALREGVIPVCSAVGGIPRVLDGFPECLSKPDASVLTQKIMSLLRSPDKAPLSDRLKTRFAERYTARRMAEKTLELYRGVLA